MNIFFESSSRDRHLFAINETLRLFISYRYSIKGFRLYVKENNLTKIDNPLYFTLSRQQEDYESCRYTQWCTKYMHWLFEEMSFPLDTDVGKLEINPTGRYFSCLTKHPFVFKYTLYPLDYVCVRKDYFPVVSLLDFFLQIKAPSHQSYGWCMNWFKSLYGGEDVWCIKRLLDAGADLKHTTDGNTIAWYQARLKCRKKCILLMGCAKRKKGMTFPRDVARLVGKWMWDKRFELKSR